MLEDDAGRGETTSGEIGCIDAGFIASVFSDHNSKMRRSTVRNRSRLMYRLLRKRELFSPHERRIAFEWSFGKS